jgi:hypothetical protein
LGGGGGHGVMIPCQTDPGCECLVMRG